MGRCRGRCRKGRERERGVGKQGSKEERIEKGASGREMGVGGCGDRGGKERVEGW